MTKVIKHSRDITTTELYLFRRKAIRKTAEFLNDLAARGWEVRELDDLVYEAKNIFGTYYVIIM